MSWFRPFVAFAAGVTLLVTPHIPPASAATNAGSVRAVAAAELAPAPLIQGVVTDQFGRYVDDVKVQATRADGTRAATSLSYASARADGPQHGYFFLEVGRVGRYTVTLSKDGYESVRYDDVQVVRRNQKLALGEIEIEKVLAATSTNATLTERATPSNERATVVVAVTTKATPKPTGVAEIREGRNVVGTAVLKAGNRGTVTVTLMKLGKGAHVLRAYFLGSQDLAASSSKRPVTLVIVKPRK